MKARLRPGYERLTQSPASSSPNPVASRGRRSASASATFASSMISVPNRTMTAAKRMPTQRSWMDARLPSLPPDRSPSTRPRTMPPISTGPASSIESQALARGQAPEAEVRVDVDRVTRDIMLDRASLVQAQQVG